MSIPSYTDPHAPRAPFKPGEAPAAAWFNIETTFAHACPNPVAMLRGQGIACEPGEDPFMAAVTAGVDREVATPETLARLADNFAKLDAGGRGVLLKIVPRLRNFGVTRDLGRLRRAL